MSRNRRKPSVRIVCTDACHHDSPEFAEHGFYYLGTMQIGKYAPDSRNPAIRFIDDTMFVKNADISIAMLRRSYRYVLRFRCTCGLDYQRGEDYILDRIERYFAANPGVTRFDLDITIL